MTMMLSTPEWNGFLQIHESTSNNSSNRSRNDKENCKTAEAVLLAHHRVLLPKPTMKNRNAGKQWACKMKRAVTAEQPKKYQEQNWLEPIACPKLLAQLKNYIEAQRVVFVTQPFSRFDILLDVLAFPEMFGKLAKVCSQFDSAPIPVFLRKVFESLDALFFLKMIDFAEFCQIMAAWDELGFDDAKENQPQIDDRENCPHQEELTTHQQQHEFELQQRSRSKDKVEYSLCDHVKQFQCWDKDEFLEIFEQQVNLGRIPDENGVTLQMIQEIYLHIQNSKSRAENVVVVVEEESLLLQTIKDLFDIYAIGSMDGTLSLEQLSVLVNSAHLFASRHCEM